MISVAIYVFALLAPLSTAQPPSNPDPTYRGSQESPKLNHSSGGMTLEALRGLPLTRPTWPPPQPQVWVYQPHIWVYPVNSLGLGGYRPPGVGGNYRLGMYWWAR